MASGSTFAPISPVLSNSPRHRGAAQQNWRQLLIVGGVSSLLAFALAELGDLREHPFVLLQSLVVLVVWLTGTGAGVAALLVGLLAVMLLTEWTTADLIAAAVFTIAGGAMAGLDHARRLTHRRLLAATEDALVRYRSLVRHAPVALALFDTDMRDLAWQPDGSLSSTALQERLDRALREPIPAFEWTYRTLTGAAVVCHVTLTRVSLKDRVGLRVASRDLTAEQAARSAARQAQVQEREALQRHSRPSRAGRSSSGS